MKASRKDGPADEISEKGRLPDESKQKGTALQIKSARKVDSPMKASRKGWPGR